MLWVLKVECFSLIYNHKLQRGQEIKVFFCVLRIFFIFSFLKACCFSNGEGWWNNNVWFIHTLIQSDRHFMINLNSNSKIIIICFFFGAELAFEILPSFYFSPCSKVQHENNLLYNFISHLFEWSYDKYFRPCKSLILDFGIFLINSHFYQISFWEFDNICVLYVFIITILRNLFLIFITLFIFTLSCFLNFKDIV